jgi:tRNA dimethylallyltransferase
LRHLEGQGNFAAFRAAGIAATRQLAKRQITWLRSMRDAIPIDPFAPDAFERVRAAVDAIELRAGVSPSD